VLRTAGRATAVGAYHQHKADRIVAEGNQGGDLVRHTLATVSPNVPIGIVHASRSKQAPPKSLISANTSRNRRAQGLCHIQTCQSQLNSFTTRFPPHYFIN
jgi:phage terminase large subunit-like protein